MVYSARNAQFPPLCLCRKIQPHAYVCAGTSTAATTAGFRQYAIPIKPPHDRVHHHGNLCSYRSSGSVRLERRGGHPWCQSQLSI